MSPLKFEATGKVYWTRHPYVPRWELEINEYGNETGWRRIYGRPWNGDGKVEEVNFFSDTNDKRIRYVDLGGDPYSKAHFDNFPPTIKVEYQ